MANASALSPATKAPGFILHFSSGSAPWHRFGVEACMRRGTGSSMRFFPSLSSSQDPQILNVIVAVTGVSPSILHPLQLSESSNRSRRGILSTGLVPASGLRTIAAWLLLRLLVERVLRELVEGGSAERGNA